MARLQTGILLLIVASWITEHGAEGCGCSAQHLQKHFCISDVVIRAKVIGQETVFPPGSLYGLHMVKYKIKVIKMFKGSDKVENLTYVYTSAHKSLCGVELSTKGQYLLSGTLFSEGRVEVQLCGLASPWDEIPQISPCHGRHCPENMCLWQSDNIQTIYGVCAKHANGSCGWIKEKSPQTLDP